MLTLFDETAGVHYGQIYVAGDDLPDMEAAFAGQSNGLCGAAQAGALFLMTATHTGSVRMTIELHGRDPGPAPEVWEEVVEASYATPSGEVALVEWAGEQWWPLALPLEPATLRVRYCAAGMDRAREVMGADLDETAGDRYLLQFWPVQGDPAPDVVVRETAAAATYWHQWARGLAPPPTAEERATAERQAAAERERREQEFRLKQETQRWDGPPPSPRLRQVVGNVHGIARLDRDLVDAVAEAEAPTQRRIAVWAARHAYTFAGIADLEWLAPAWAALDRGEPAPESIADMKTQWDRIRGDHHYGEVVSVTMHQSSRPMSGPASFLDHDVDPVAMALPALAAAGVPDPLQAALESLWAAATAYGRDHPTFLAEVRRAFPELAAPPGP